MLFRSTQQAIEDFVFAQREAMRNPLASLQGGIANQHQAALKNVADNAPVKTPSAAQDYMKQARIDSKKRLAALREFNASFGKKQTYTYPYSFPNATSPLKPPDYSAMREYRKGLKDRIAMAKGDSPLHSAEELKRYASYDLRGQSQAQGALENMARNVPNDGAAQKVDSFEKQRLLKIGRAHV